MIRSAALALLAALALAGCGETERAGRPDILLVVLDTVRADRCSAYGYARPTTVQLEALAEVAVLFEDVTAPGAWTVPSHASLFTGVGPWEHGADILEDAPDGAMRVGAMRAELPTLAERLAAAGYRTVAIAANDWLGPEFGITRGFARTSVVRSDALAMEEVAKELAADDARPLFLFVNLMAAHSPYEDGPGEWSVGAGVLDPATAPAWLAPYLLGDRRPPSVHLGRETPPDGLDGFTRYLARTLAIPPGGIELLAKLYDAGVRGADFSLGRILEQWIARSPDSIVAVTADHGEAFAEHGLVEHRAGVYPELVRVPLVLAGPGLPPGTRVREPVQLHDLHPTLLELAGLGGGATSLVGIAQGGKRAGPIASQAPPYGRWKRHVGGRFARAWRLYRVGDRAIVFDDGGAGELYDPIRDPAMRADLAAAEPDRTAALRSEALAWFASAERPGTGAVAIPPEALERLRALGYAEK